MTLLFKWIALIISILGIEFCLALWAGISFANTPLYILYLLSTTSSVAVLGAVLVIHKRKKEHTANAFLIGSLLQIFVLIGFAFAILPTHYKEDKLNILHFVFLCFSCLTLEVLFCLQLLKK